MSQPQSHPPAPTTLNDLLLRIKERWRGEFLEYVRTGACSEGFKHYIENNPEADETLDEAVRIYAKALHDSGIKLD